MNKELISIKNVSYRYDKRRLILDSVDTQLQEGELVCLLGPNGAGKSTLLKCIMGVLNPFQGEIFIGKKKVLNLSYHERASLIAYVPQHSRVIFDHSVKEYVTMGLASKYPIWGKPSLEDLKYVEKCLDRMEIGNLSDRPFRSLSGGEQQKTMIARALVQHPKILLCDEPTSALDIGNQNMVLHLIKELAQDGYSIITTTHNPNHPFFLVCSVWMLNKQGHLATGMLKEIMTTSNVSGLYEAEIEVVDLPQYNRMICIAK